MRRLLLCAAATACLSACNADGPVDRTAVGDVAEVAAAAAVTTAVVFETPIDQKMPDLLNDPRCQPPRRWEVRQHDGNTWWTCVEDQR